MPTGQLDAIDTVPVSCIVLDCVGFEGRGAGFTSAGVVTVDGTVGTRGRNHFDAFCLVFSMSS
jgi:hypothetical protein